VRRAEHQRPRFFPRLLHLVLLIIFVGDSPDIYVKFFVSIL
jgi:hypothetical protein